MLRNRYFLPYALSLSCLILTSTTAPAQVVAERKGSEHPWIYQLTVDPAPETSPALRYRFLRSVAERKPGNAASYYYRALALFQEGPQKTFIEIYPKIEELADSNKQLTGFPAEQVREFLTSCEPIFLELESAAMCDRCDWGVEVRDLTTQQAIELRLPEIQNSRNLARLLLLKARLAIVDRKYDDAFHAIQLGFQLGKDVSEFPSIISSLVGVAINAMMTTPLMDLIAEPGSPNFYWAAATIPTPLIDLNPALEFEFNWALKLPLIREADQSHTPEEWKRLLAETFQFMQQMQGTSSMKSSDGSDLKTQFDVMQRLLKEYPRAKIELTRFGYTPQQAEEMPVIQVVALHDAKLIPYKRDDILRWTALPFALASTPLRTLDSSPQPPENTNRIADLRESLNLFQTLRPAVAQVVEAVARLDRRFVRIQAIEALRMYAAANDRKFPSSLADIKLVPVPLDPITGRPIIYRLEGETAVLEFPPPQPENIGSLGETFRLTLRKAN